MTSSLQLHAAQANIFPCVHLQAFLHVVSLWQAAATTSSVMEWLGMLYMLSFSLVIVSTQGRLLALSTW